MKTFKEESGLNTTSTKCGLSYDRQKRSEETKCKEIQKDFDNPNEWSMGEIAESPTTSRFERQLILNTLIFRRIKVL